MRNVGSSAKKFLFSFVLILGVLAIAYAVEHSLRFLAPENGLPFNGVKDGRRYTWGIEVKVNPAQYRERELVVPKPPGVTRIMVIGDSLTWGVGLNVEERYTNILEKALTRRYPEKKFEVLNFAGSGGAIDFYHYVVNMWTERVNPDLYVIGFCTNDLQPKGGVLSPKREIFTERWRKYFQFVLLFEKAGLKALGTHLETSTYKVAEILGVIPDFFTYRDQVFEPSSVNWQEFVRILKDIEARSNDMRLPSPVFASLDGYRVAANKVDAKETPRSRLFEKWLRRAQRAASEIGFVVIDYVDDFSDYNEQDLVINRADGHPSALAHRIFAQKLLKVISPLFE